MALDIETVGLGFDTSGIERGIRSLDDLAARGPKVEKSLDGVEGAAQKAGKAISGIGDGDAGRSLEKTGESAGKAAGKIADLSGSSGKASTAMREVQRSAGALTESLITGGSATGTLATSLSRLAISAPGIGLLVGSIAAVTKAALDGAKEQRNFANALILTGNISGQTVGQLVAYSRAMQDAHTTQGAAAASLAEFVKAGVKGGDMLGDYAKAATDWEKATGQAVGKTAQQFAALQSAPLSAVLKLNEGMNFLTAQSYLAIKALEEQGNTTDAARLAQEEYANAMTSRSSEVQANLGTLEKAWDGVTNAAKKAWDSMLNVGRERTLQDRIADATAAVQAARSALDRAQQQQSGVPSWLRSSTGVEAAQANLSAAERTESDLRTQAALEETLASARAENAEAVKALAGFETLRSRNLSADERRQRSQIELATAYQQVLDKGNLTEQQRADLEAQYLSAATNITGTEKERAAAVKATADAYGPLIQRLQGVLAIQQLEMQQGEKLTQSQRLQLDIDQQLASGKLKLNTAQKASVDGLLASIAAGEKYKANMAAQVELQKQANKEWDAMSAAYAAIVKAQASSAESVEKSVQRMQDEAQARRMSAAMGISQARAIELVNIKRLEERLALVRGREGQSRHVEEIEREIEARKRLADEIGGKDAYEASVKAAKDAADEWQKTSDSINQSLTDALMRGFESGKDFAKNMRDTVVNMFKTMVLKPVIQMVLNPISMGLAGILGGSSAMAGQGGGMLGTLGMAGNAMSAYNMFNGGLGATLFGNSLAYSALTPGLALGGQQAAMLAAQTGEFGLAGATATAQAGGAGLGGFGGLLSSPLGIAAVGAGLAAAFGLFRKTVKRGDVLTGTLGVDDGIRSGDLMRKDGSLFGGPNWFVNDTGVSGLDKAIQAQWDASLKTVEQWSKALGLSTDKIEGFTATLGTETLGDHGAIGIRLDKDGTPLSDQEIQAKIAEAIRSGSNELAQQLIGTWETSMEEVTRQVRNSNWDSAGGLYSTVTEQVERSTYKPSEFARDGEQAIDTLTRLGSSLVATTTAFRTLGLSLYDASLAGGDMASKLVDWFGGLEQFQQATSTYFAAFYSRDEQRAAARAALQEQFAQASLVMPDLDSADARAQFRALAESLDRTSAEGQRAWASMMQLSGAFAELAQDAQELRQQQQDAQLAMQQSLMGTVDAAFAALQRSVQAERDSINAALADQLGAIASRREALRAAQQESKDAMSAQLSAARSTHDAARSLFEMLRNQVAQLYQQVDSTAAMSAAQGMVYIERALASARAGSQLPDQDALQGAIFAAAGGISDGAYATQFERDRDRLVLAGQLDELRAMSGAQMSDAQRQIDALTLVSDSVAGASKAELDALSAAEAGARKSAQEQISRLDAVVKGAQEQIDALKGVDTSVKSVAQAMASLAGAIAQAKSAGVSDTSFVDRVRGSTMSATGIATTAAGRQVQASQLLGQFDIARASAYLQRYPDVAKAYERGPTYGLTPEQYAAWHYAMYGIDERRQFAKGGYYPGGMALVGERGPELINFAQPGQVYTNSQTAAMFDQSALLEEMRAMREEMQRLRASSERTATGMAQMAEQFDQVTEGGNILRTEVVA